MRIHVACAPGLLIAAVSHVEAGAAAPDLARYFGWAEPRIIVVDRGAGPAVSEDFNGDGLIDLACVNNAKSRIELHLQRAVPRSDQEVEREYKANELPPSPWFDRVEVSVSHRIGAFRAHDVDGDGLLDILYAGDGAELVVLRQTSPLKFTPHSKRRVKDLQARQDGLKIADVLGDGAPDLLVIAGGRINVFGLSSSGPVGEPVLLGSGDSKEQIVAFFIEDYSGNGLSDVLAVIPDDPTPLRLWFQERRPEGGDGKFGLLSPEFRFEMPPLVEVEPVRVPDRAAASIAVIERPTRRIVLYDVRFGPSASADTAAAVEVDASIEVHAFPSGSSKGRSLAAHDLDGDGLPELLATDQQANSILLYRQEKGVGLKAEERFSALKDPKAVAVGRWDDDDVPEVFVLSEADKVVGVSQCDRAAGRLGFPQAVMLATPGGVPVAMAYVPPPTGPALAVVVKDKRDHTLEVHRPASGAGSPPAVLKLEGVTRPPQSMLVGDFDHDRRTDLLLLTPGDPLVMVRSIDADTGEMRMLTDKLMPQFGLVQAAGPENTAELDINGDGFAELLIADQNFVRACAFSEEKGWRVVEQITLPDPSSSLATLAVMPGDPPTIIASDKANKRLVLMSKDASGAWSAPRRLRFPAFAVTSLHAGRFAGTDEPSILASGESAFAVVRLAGPRASLEEVAAYRSDADDRFEHEIEVGDVNSDGFTDLVVLDAREQMCQVFTLSRSRRLHFATEFKVFESRLFGRGDDRQFEPRAALIADFTGDGRDDLCLEVHDRYVIYPQMTGPR